MAASKDNNSKEKRDKKNQESSTRKVDYNDRASWAVRDDPIALCPSIRSPRISLTPDDNGRYKISGLCAIKTRDGCVWTEKTNGMGMGQCTGKGVRHPDQIKCFCKTFDSFYGIIHDAVESPVKLHAVLTGGVDYKKRSALYLLAFTSTDSIAKEEDIKIGPESRRDIVSQNFIASSAVQYAFCEVGESDFEEKRTLEGVVYSFAKNWRKIGIHPGVNELDILIHGEPTLEDYQKRNIRRAIRSVYEIPFEKGGINIRELPVREKQKTVSSLFDLARYTLINARSSGVRANGEGSILTVDYTRFKG